MAGEINYLISPGRQAYPKESGKWYILLSESSVAEMISKESAVEIIAAIAPVMRIAASAGGKSFNILF